MQRTALTIAIGTVVALTSPYLIAQGGVEATMQEFSEAISTLCRDLDQDAAVVSSGALDALRRGTAALRRPDALAARGTSAPHWLDEIDDAVSGLAQSSAPAARRRFDAVRLRRACTACHLESRNDNADRGLFPNHDNAVYGRLELFARDGAARPDRSGAVVFLEGANLPASPPLPRKVDIKQAGRQFQPRVTVVTAGSTVRFPNDDIVFHNVFSKSKKNPFDLGTYGKGVVKEHVMRQTGLVQVHCNIHPNMSASVLVLANDRAAITAADGFWSIADVPDGDYRLRVWHPRANVEPRPITVRNGQAVNIALRVDETKSRVPHSNKHGRRYRTRY